MWPVDDIFVLPGVISSCIDTVSACMSVRHLLLADPTAWKSLSNDLNDLSLSVDSLRCLLKTQLFSEY